MINGANSVAKNERVPIEVLEGPTHAAGMKYQNSLSSFANGSASNGDSVESLLDFVAADRLRRMPHKGSRWDKILKWLEIFAGHVSMFQQSMKFASKNQEAAELIWGACRVVVQVSFV